MPRPARIVEYRARERDKIGIAGRDDRLGLIDAAISPTAIPVGNGGLDGTGERHLIAPDRNRRAGCMPPLETVNRSTAADRRPSAKAMVCSRSQPPSTQSVPDTRMLTGRSTGKTVRTASNISNGKRIRFSSEPP